MGERPKVGVSVVVIREGKVLIGKRKGGGHGDGTWAFPGGHLEFGEIVEECARREVLEEAGIKIRDIRIGPYTNDIFRKDEKCCPEGKHYITLFLVSEKNSGEPVNREPELCGGWVWASWDKLPKPLFLPIENLLKRGYNPFGARAAKRE